MGLTREQDSKQWILVHHQHEQYRVECAGKTVGRLTVAARDRIIVESEDLWKGPVQELAVEEELEEANQQDPFVPPSFNPEASAMTLRMPAGGISSRSGGLDRDFQQLGSPGYLGLMSPASPAAGVFSQPPSATCDPLAGYQSPIYSPAVEVKPKKAVAKAPTSFFYTISGCLSVPSPRHPTAAGGMLVYVRRQHGSRHQEYLGEGQLSARKARWGRQEYFYEARMPVQSKQDDALLVMGTLLAMLTQLQ